MIEGEGWGEEASVSIDGERFFGRRPGRDSSSYSSGEEDDVLRRDVDSRRFASHCGEIYIDAAWCFLTLPIRSRSICNIACSARRGN